MKRIVDGRVNTQHIVESAVTTPRVASTAITDAKLDSHFQHGQLVTLGNTATVVSFPTAFRDTPAVMATPGPGQNWVRVQKVYASSFEWQGAAGPPAGTASWFAWGHRA